MNPQKRERISMALAAGAPATFPESVTDLPKSSALGERVSVGVNLCNDVEVGTDDVEVLVVVGFRGRRLTRVFRSRRDPRRGPANGAAADRQASKPYRPRRTLPSAKRQRTENHDDSSKHGSLGLPIACGLSSKP